MARRVALNTIGVRCYRRQHLLVVPLIAAVLTPLAVIRADEFSLGEIRTQLEASTRLITALAGHQVAIHRPTGPSSRGPNAPLIMEDLRIETAFLFDFQEDRSSITENRQWYYRELSDEPFSNTGVLCRYDGTQCYGLITTPGEHPALRGIDMNTVPAAPPNVPYRLVIGPSDHTRTKHLIRSLAGLPCSGLNLSLAAILSANTTRILKTDLVDGVKCVHVSADVMDRHLDAALDPNAGWLPRRYEIRPESTGFRYVHQVSEFQQFPVPGTDRFVWFPVRGSRSIFDKNGLFAKVDLTLEDLRVNPDLDPDEFRIEISSLPPGVQVQGPTGITYTGNAKDEFKKVSTDIDASTDVMDRLLQKSRGQVAQETPVRVQSRPFSTTLTAIVAIASVSLLVLGIRLRHRS